MRIKKMLYLHQKESVERLFGYWHEAKHCPVRALTNPEIKTRLVWLDDLCIMSILMSIIINIWHSYQDLDPINYKDTFVLFSSCK